MPPVPHEKGNDCQINLLLCVFTEENFSLPRSFVHRSWSVGASVAGTVEETVHVRIKTQDFCVGERSCPAVDYSQPKKLQHLSTGLTKYHSARDPAIYKMNRERDVHCSSPVLSPLRCHLRPFYYAAFYVDHHQYTSRAVLDQQEMFREGRCQDFL